MANNVALWNIGSASGSVTRPALRLVAAGGSANLMFASETNVTYDLLFASSLTGAFSVVETQNGTGGELTFPLGSVGVGQGFYQVLATPNGN